MPIFEFNCDNCSHTIEKIMSFKQSEEYQGTCKCKKGKIKKVPVNKFNMSFKGRWYKNTGAY
mgnify:CR=1 FL=1